MQLKMKSKKKWLLALAVLSLVNTVSKGEICAASGGFAPSLTDVARNEDGRVREMNQYDADSYCRNQGLRLPTARELAHYAQSLGAQGVSETKKVGYALVEGSDHLGNRDNFYFNPRGYRPSPGDLGELWLWSSSLDPVFLREAYIMSGLDGGFEVVVREYYSHFGFYAAVRCVRSR